MVKNNYGWAGKIAWVDLTDGKIDLLSTFDFLDLIGGRGIATRLYWDFVSPSAGALSPENALILMTGPLGGTQAIAASRLVAVFKSPQLYPEQCGLGSLGGHLPASLKRAGFDGLVITGKSKTPCCISIDNGKIRLEEGRNLWGLDTQATLMSLSDQHGKSSESLCIGPAGENQIHFAIAVASKGSTLGHGFGAVMGSKGLKAITVKGNKKVAVARPAQLKELNREIRAMVKGRFLMDPMIGGIDLVKRAPCRGCPMGCPRGVYRHVSGMEDYRKNCASSYFYYDWEKERNNGEPGDTSFLATSICNKLGICTQELAKLLRWLDQAFKQNLLTRDASGLDWAQVGTPEFFEGLAHKIVRRQGICDLLAMGVMRTARHFGDPGTRILNDYIEGAGFSADLYNGRFFLTNAVFHATDRTNPMTQLHEICYPLFKWTLWYATDGMMSSVSTEAFMEIAKKFWIDERAVDFSTYKGKGKVAALIQNREYAKETLVACDFFYPIVTPEGRDDHVGDPTIESRILSAVIGQDISEQNYYRIGERVFHLQRLVARREGHRGREDDRLPEFNFTEPLLEDKIYFGMFNPEFMLPGPNGDLITRKGATLDRDKFAAMIDEYYQARGWDQKTGHPTIEKLKELLPSEFIDRIPDHFKLDS